MQRPVFAKTLLAACLALASLACEEETPPELAPGTFGGKHRAEIENDCDKRVTCAARTNPHLRSDAFDHCVSTNATNLNALPDFRLRFLLGLTRCTQPDACQYVQCVDSTYVSYGQQQIDKVNYSCQQKMQCGIDTATLAVAPADYYETCQIQSILALDMYPNETRTSYQTQFFPCMPQVSCAFQQCFPF